LNCKHMLCSFLQCLAQLPVVSAASSTHSHHPSTPGNGCKHALRSFLQVSEAGDHNCCHPSTPGKECLQLLPSFLQCQQQAATSAITPPHQAKGANMPCAVSCRRSLLLPSQHTRHIVCTAPAQLPAVSAAGSNIRHHPRTPEQVQTALAQFPAVSATCGSHSYQLRYHADSAESPCTASCSEGSRRAQRTARACCRGGSAGEWTR
jgi:hypothetical protein